MSDSIATNFIHDIIEQDLNAGKHGSEVITRFPPEPNGYLHIGHAKSICLNFGTARKYKGRCHLRFDDTNPTKEEVEYVDSIQADVKWLGFDWGEHLYYASDYFDKIYACALELIQKGKAYVCDLTADQTREYRGTLNQPGKPSPYRDRSVQENFDLFERMRNGEFAEGTRVLRAKIDMASPNLNMRDPVLYRIIKRHHDRTGDKWCIYPMYDFTHPISDAIEHITHSICTLEFEDHRPLYDWTIQNVTVPATPQQIEFARLNLTYTVMSKRYLLEMVNSGLVKGWDDPRMPTIAGLRRRGYTPESIREFADRIGVAKTNSTVDFALLDFCLREDLNRKALRVMAVLNPLKVVISNYPEDQVEWLDAENNPEDPSAGTRKIPFSRTIYIEKDDFREDPPKKFFRLSPGKEIRLKHAYYITCTEVIKDSQSGEVIELRCTYDPESRGGWTNDGRKVMGTSHWVSAVQAVSAEVRVYDSLFLKADPYDVPAGMDFKANLNPNSLSILNTCLVEPELKNARIGVPYQFLRQGYFCVDQDSRPDALVFNRTVGLKDTWNKQEK